MLVVGFEGRPFAQDGHQTPRLEWLAEGEALKLLQEASAAGNIPQSQIFERLQETLDWLPNIEAGLMEIVDKRAQQLRDSHRRVRHITKTGKVNVRPAKDGLDVLGFYVFLPVPKGLIRP